jgi:hypothetical protein
LYRARFGGSAAIGRGGDRGHGWFGRVVSATLMDAPGRKVGVVWMREDRRGDVVQIAAGLREHPGALRGPDQETLNTGDSGSRMACGVVR